MYQRPGSLNDHVVDLFDLASNNPVMVRIESYDYAVDYKKLRTGNQIHSPAILMNPSGQQISSSYSVIRSGTTATTIMFSRVQPVVGLYADEIIHYTLLDTSNEVTQNRDGSVDVLGKKPVEVQRGQYSYFVFQKAVAAVTFDGSIVTQGAAVSATQNTPARLLSLSRGSELGYIVKFEIRNGSDWITAVQNIDYSLAGPIDGDDNITFLKLGEYRITVTVNGYTSNNNPYGSINQERELVLSNTDSITFTVNTGVAIPVEAITFPKIETIVIPENVISSSPVTTYSHSIINVQANVLFNTGQWVIDSVTRPTTDSEWLNEIANMCNVRLHVREELTGVDVIPPMDGFGPHTVKIPKTGTFLINYITSLK